MKPLFQSLVVTYWVMVSSFAFSWSFFTKGVHELSGMNHHSSGGELSGLVWSGDVLSMNMDNLMIKPDSFQNGSFQNGSFQDSPEMGWPDTLITDEGVKDAIQTCNRVLNEWREQSFFHPFAWGWDEKTFPQVVLFRQMDDQNRLDETEGGVPVCVFNLPVSLLSAAEGELADATGEENGVFLVSLKEPHAISYWARQSAEEENDVPPSPCSMPLIGACSGGDGRWPPEGRDPYNVPEDLFTFDDDDVEGSSAPHQLWALLGETLLNLSCSAEAGFSENLRECSSVGESVSGCHCRKYVLKPGLRGGSKQGGVYPFNSGISGGAKIGGAFSPNKFFAGIGKGAGSGSGSFWARRPGGGSRGGGTPIPHGCGGFGKGSSGSAMGSAKCLSKSSAYGSK